MTVKEWIYKLGLLELKLHVKCSTDQGVYELIVVETDMAPTRIPEDVMNREIDDVDIMEEVVVIWVKEERY